ncbi:MAG: hypothetical protein AMXMBFR57_20620 [Acidimicrobiia bacterium]|jgi:hypothetical protein
MDQKTIDAVFEAFGQRRRLGRRREEIEDPDFWRRLNPQLTISDGPLAPRVTPLDFPPDQARWHADFMQEEGYLQTRPVFSAVELAPLREAVERVVAADLPSGMVWLYDEFYLLLARVESILEPMLGRAPLLLPKDFWVFYVPAGTAGRTGFGAYGPHRDYYVDDGFAAGQRPSVVNTWIPLTDVTTLDSCMYVVHPEGDADFRGSLEAVRQDQLTLTDIRALPTPAGALIAFTSRIAHWGSRSSRFATGPRIAMTCVLQRRDVAPFSREVIDLTAPLPWSRRLALVLDSVGESGLEGGRLLPR